MAAIIATSAKPNPIDDDKPPSVYSIPQPRRGSGVLPEPSIKILYDLPKGAQLIGAENANWAPEAVYGGGFAAARLRAMELITILNRCHRFPGFVYQHAHLGADKKSIEVAVRPRKGSTAV